jgi:hypothetical protein
MRRLKHARPSPALLVAIVALVGALAGTAVAEQATTSVSKKKTKKIARNQATKVLDEALPIGSGELGEIETRSASTTVTNNYSEQTANCENDERVISGGIKVDNAAVAEFSNYTFESYRQDEGWYARVYIVGTRNWTVEAYCLEP